MNPIRSAGVSPTVVALIVLGCVAATSSLTACCLCCFSCTGKKNKR